MIRLLRQEDPICAVRVTSLIYKLVIKMAVLWCRHHYSLHYFGSACNFDALLYLCASTMHVHTSNLVD